MCVCVFILVSMGDLVPQEKFKNILSKNLWIVTGNQLKLAQVKTKILVSILKIPALPTLIMSGSKSLKCHHQSQSIFISLPCFPLDWPYFYDFMCLMEAQTYFILSASTLRKNSPNQNIILSCCRKIPRITLIRAKGD